MITEQRKDINSELLAKEEAPDAGLSDSHYIDQQAGKADSETNVYLARLKRISESLANLLDKRSQEIQELITFLLKQQKQEVLLTEARDNSQVTEVGNRVKEKISTIFEKSLSGLRKGVEAAPEVMKIIKQLELDQISDVQGSVGKNLLSVLRLARSANEIAQSKGVIRTTPESLRNNRLLSLINAANSFLIENPKFRAWVVETINRVRNKS